MGRRRNANVKAEPETHYQIGPYLFKRRADPASSAPTVATRLVGERVLSTATSPPSKGKRSRAVSQPDLKATDWRRG